MARLLRTCALVLVLVALSVSGGSLASASSAQADTTQQVRSGLAKTGKTMPEESSKEHREATKLRGFHCRFTAAQQEIQDQLAAGAGVRSHPVAVSGTEPGQKPGVLPKPDAPPSRPSAATAHTQHQPATLQVFRR